MQGEQFLKASNKEDVNKVLGEWRGQGSLFGDPSPDERYGKFAVDLAGMFRYMTQTELKNALNEAMSTVQLTAEPDMFAGTEQIPLEKALKEAFEDYLPEPKKDYNVELNDKSVRMSIDEEKEEDAIRRKAGEKELTLEKNNENSSEGEEKSVTLQPKNEKEDRYGRGNRKTSKVLGMEGGVPQRQEPTRGNEGSTGLVATGRQVANEKILSNNVKQLLKAHLLPIVVRRGSGQSVPSFDREHLTDEQDKFVQRVADETSNSIFPITIVNSAKEFVDELERCGLPVTESSIENDKGVVPGLYLPDEGRIIIYPQGMLYAKNGRVSGVDGAEQLYQETIYHEGKAHFGLKTLLGNHFDDFCGKVWKGMSDANRADKLAYHWDNNIPETDDKDISKEKILKAININKPNNVLWKQDPEHQNRPYLNQTERNEILRGYPDEMQNGAADEYVAQISGDSGIEEYCESLANKVLIGDRLTQSEKSIWNSFKDWLREFYKIDKLTDKEIAEVVKISSDIFDSQEVAGGNDVEREANRQTQLRDLRTRAGRIRGGVAKRGEQKQVAANKANSLAKKLKVDISVDDDTSPVRFSIGEGDNRKYTIDPETGKISIVAGKHNSPESVEHTILSATASRTPLRSIFGDRFTGFLENVYNNSAREVRNDIAQIAARNGWDFHRATEEYLANVAREGNIDPNNTWWRGVKREFQDMLGDKREKISGENKVKSVKPRGSVQ